MPSLRHIAPTIEALAYSLRMEKQCRRCERTLPVESFSITRGRWPDSYCRDCRCDLQRERRATLPQGYYNDANRRARARLRQRVLDYLGGKCVQCGFSDRRALQVDHCNSDGHVDRVTKPGRALYHAILRGERDDAVQLLCANCNAIKQWELHEWAGAKRES